MLSCINQTPERVKSMNFHTLQQKQKRQISKQLKLNDFGAVSCQIGL